MLVQKRKIRGRVDMSQHCLCRLPPHVPTLNNRSARTCNNTACRNDPQATARQPCHESQAFTKAHHQSLCHDTPDQNSMHHKYHLGAFNHNHTVSHSAHNEEQ